MSDGDVDGVDRSDVVGGVDRVDGLDGVGGIDSSDGVGGVDGVVDINRTGCSCMVPMLRIGAQIGAVQLGNLLERYHS